MSELSDFLAASKQSAKDQIDMTKEVLTNHLDHSDRIHLRQNSEALSREALALIAADPTL